MELIKRLRAPLTSVFTRIANLLENKLNDENKDTEEIEILYAQLDEKWVNLEPKEKEMLDLLLNDKSCKQENYDTEYESFSLYEEKFIKLKTKVQNFFKVSVTENITKRKFKLPKIEFKIFGGDIKEWLAFWAQFEKIHYDSDIAKKKKINVSTCYK